MADPRRGVTGAISEAKATPEQEALSKDLERLLRTEYNQYQTKEQERERAQVIVHLQNLIKSWVKAIYEEEKVAFDPNQGAQIYTYGSYRLGVNAPDGDVDTLILCGSEITREHFFGRLLTMLREHPEAKEIVEVPDAYVPVITVTFYGVEFDLAYAQLQRPNIPEKLDLLDDSILPHNNDAVVRALNGRRVTDLMLDLVPSPETFRLTLRCIKQWSKCRGIYSNALGFLGGVSWAILVARICQCLPNATASSVILLFFMYFSKPGVWTSRIRLNRQDDSEVKDSPLIILTPAYPTQNSTFNVTRSTLAIISAEMVRGAEVVSSIMSHQESWKKLFEPIDFFALYPGYIQIDSVGASEETFTRWTRYMESKLRFLVKFLEETGRGYFCIHPFPKSFAKPESAIAEGFTHSKVFFFGIGPVENKPQPKEPIDLGTACTRFLQKLMATRPDTKDGASQWQVDTLVYYIKRNELPLWIFPDGIRPKYKKRKATEITPSPISAAPTLQTPSANMNKAAAMNGGVMEGSEQDTSMPGAVPATSRSAAQTQAEEADRASIASAPEAKRQKIVENGEQIIKLPNQPTEAALPPNVVSSVFTPSPNHSTTNSNNTVTSSSTNSASLDSNFALFPSVHGASTSPPAGIPSQSSSSSPNVSTPTVTTPTGAPSSPSTASTDLDDPPAITITKQVGLAKLVTIVKPSRSPYIEEPTVDPFAIVPVAGAPKKRPMKPSSAKRPLLSLGGPR